MLLESRQGEYILLAIPEIKCKGPVCGRQHYQVTEVEPSGAPVQIRCQLRTALRSLCSMSPPPLCQSASERKILSPQMRQTTLGLWGEARFSRIPCEVKHLEYIFFFFVKSLLCSALQLGDPAVSYTQQMGNCLELGTEAWKIFLSLNLYLIKYLLAL